MNGLLKKLKCLIKGDEYYLNMQVPQPNLVSHLNKMEYLQKIGNKKGMRILEIGSREVTGKSAARKVFSEATYIGFDIYKGKNVDVVGDAHKLSSYFDEKFDIIYTCACFEHFAMPWVVAEEINKLLKVGGYVFVETHFSFSMHERPWNFFQYSDMGLKVLFSPAMGFECLDAGMSNPIVGMFSSYADEYLRNKPVKGLYCHSSFLGRKTTEVEKFCWQNTPLDSLVNKTTYPAPQEKVR